METLLASRIELTPRPYQNHAPVLVCGMVGHCPGRVRKQRLFDLPEAVDAIRAAGFGTRLEALRSADDAIFHLPVPLNSSAEFHDIFPDAASSGTDYQSTLAGANAWLPGCVDDFFANGGTRLWIVAVPEEKGHEAFLPAPDTVLHDTSTLRGVASLLVIPAIGLLALPDLERLQIPANLPGIPEPDYAREAPQFMPCSTPPPKAVTAPEAASSNPTEPMATAALLRQILPWLCQHRPDIQCLWSVPLTYDQDRQIPAASSRALEAIGKIAVTPAGHRLRQVQFVFPYLTNARGRPVSSCGVLAGAQSGVAQTNGPWRSIAGRILVTSGDPFPPQSIPAQQTLRQHPGISVITRKPRGVMLDDERLTVPALHPDDYSRSRLSGRYDAFRSAEVMRFLGHLRRQLQRLGETLVFRVDYRDPTPRLALENFFGQLHRLGALRGKLPEEAFRVKQLQLQEGAAVFEIMLAPALPIDRIRLTFTNRHGEWQGEVQDE
ncbi:hypothetical protein [Marinobacter orientalis]|uniref:Uncharacterized protein n=1 Tax=Marinobacter orientalis TaxID=1928859 RepID=A0A7Y0RF01_9GAMM|nr:hypothetical protein [Marinobacter orientalis]NMT64996.1 hypothetical protein [Marinobacter orientalis]TGX48113.1 hypothetical protein DIT72_15955 [Marinobacter orientalis]